MQSLVLDASPANIRRALAFSVLWIVLLPVNVMAASFDCKKGQTFVEQAICSHQRLSTLDNQLAKAYQRALDIAFAPDNLREEQRNWLTSVRNVCQNTACLKRAYEQRLESLATYGDRQRTSKGPGGYFYIAERALNNINPISRRFFGRPVDLVYLAKAGNLSIGEEAPEGTTLITSESIHPEFFYDKTAPLAGPAGLEDAIRKGLLRKATDADVDAWVNAVVASTSNRDVPPIAGQGRPKPLRPSTYNAYVVLTPFTYPSGLYGGNLATFFIPKGIPRPTGNSGHSSVYDFNRLNCEGPLCR